MCIFDTVSLLFLNPFLVIYLPLLDFILLNSFLHIIDACAGRRRRGLIENHRVSFIAFFLKRSRQADSFLVFSFLRLESNLIRKEFKASNVKSSHLRLFRQSPSSLKNEAVKDKEDNEGAPVIGDDQGRVEDGVLEELDHALARIEVPLAGEVLPAKDAHKEEDSGHQPGDDDHGQNLDVKGVNDQEALIFNNCTLFPVLHDLYRAASLTEQNLSTVINSTESWKVYLIWSSNPDIINNSISPPPTCKL